MQPIEFVARTLFVHVPDGRIVFRPWGSRGRCYLVTPEQRRSRARWQAAYYALMIGTVSYGMMYLGTAKTFAVVLPIILAGNYVLFWHFSRGLTTTDPPPRPSRAEMHEHVRQANRALGKPLLLTMLAVCVAGTLFGIGAGVALGLWNAAIPVILFCSACAAVFAWQLRNL